MEGFVGRLILSLVVSMLCATQYGVEAESLTELINRRPDLVESAKFSKKSGVLEDIEYNLYGGELTVLLPSNRAWRAVSPARKAYLLDPNNREDLETLMLFSTTDAVYRYEDLYDGMEPLVTLLGVEASVEKSNDMICVLSMDTGEKYACGEVVTWDIPVNEGVVHIIDEVLFPEELISVMPPQNAASYRRLGDK